MVKAGIFQAELLTGFPAPICPGCTQDANHLDIVVREQTPYVLQITYTWDSEKCQYHQTTEMIIADSNRKPIEKLICGRCGKVLTKKSREIFEMGVK
jgi:hypothetical protein